MHTDKRLKVFTIEAPGLRLISYVARQKKGKQSVKSAWSILH